MDKVIGLHYLGLLTKYIGLFSKRRTNGAHGAYFYKLFPEPALEQCLRFTRMTKNRLFVKKKKKNAQHAMCAVVYSTRQIFRDNVVDIKSTNFEICVGDSRTRTSFSVLTKISVSRNHFQATSVAGF